MHGRQQKPPADRDSATFFLSPMKPQSVTIMHAKLSPAAAAGLILVLLVVLIPGCTTPSAARPGGNGSAGCPPGFATCPSGCADLQRDVFNCGICGSSCDQTGYLCQKGVCACEPGFTNCSGECVDLQLDDSYCGSCNHFCTRGYTCSDGVCVHT